MSTPAEGPATVTPDFRPTIIAALTNRLMAVQAACDLAEGEARHVVDDEAYVSVGLIRNALHTSLPVEGPATVTPPLNEREAAEQMTRTRDIIAGWEGLAEGPATPTCTCSLRWDAAKGSGRDPAECAVHGDPAEGPATPPVPGAYQIPTAAGPMWVWTIGDEHDTPAEGPATVTLTDEDLARMRAEHEPQAYEFETAQTYCPASDGPTDQCDGCNLLARVGALTADLAAARARELDNHHNAAVCPYCTPALAEAERVIANVRALADEAWTTANGHSAVLADDLRALLPAAPTGEGS